MRIYFDSNTQKDFKKPEYFIVYIVKALRDKNRSRANCVPIYGDLYQNLQWSLIFDLKVVTHLKSASEASYDVINMATIMRNCSLIKAMVCVGMAIFIQHERFF